MKHAVSLPNFGPYADANLVVELAVLAEASGWDGFFVWDHIVIGGGVPVADPWIQLAAIAYATDEITIGPMVTPLPRRRPWVLSRQATTVDHLCKGRLILGVGIGFPSDIEFGTFGEPVGDRERADMLDEGLTVLHGMWSGRAFSFAGEHYSVEPLQFAPAPYRTTGIPIWVAAMWPNRRPMRRAARHDGLFPVKLGDMPWTPDEVAELTSLIQDERGSLSDFDIVVGASFSDCRSLGDAYRTAGATWCVTGPGEGQPIEALQRAISAGPA